MSSTVSFGVSNFFAFLMALATSPEDTSNATAIAVPHVHTFDMVEMVSSVSNNAMDVVIPTAIPV